MALCVVDASVVAKWFLEEEFSTEARRLRDDYAADLIDVAAPCLLPYEVLNAPRFANVFSTEELRRIAEALDRFAIPLHLLEGALSEATLDIATSRGLTVYDASYAALARHLASPLYSADDELIRAIRDVAEVRHIIDYSTPEG
ncbi:MAG: type II toxin-antitoxin system VapC family toxin [Thermoplasmata archaeon]